MNPHVARAIADLQTGKTITRKERGNSMVPLIRSNQPTTLRPVLSPERARELGCEAFVDPEELKEGDIVLAKVRGNVYTHLISGVRGSPGNREWQISNNRGHVNGWTRQVFGRVVGVH